MIQNLRELKALLALCRKEGVKEIKVGDVSLVMGEAPPKRPRGRAAARAAAEDPAMPGMPTDDQLAFWSVGGGAGEDH